MTSSPKRVTQVQLAITLAAVTGVLYIRLMLLPRSSPFELFLLLNILVAVLFRPPATLASIASGFTGAWVVTLVKGRVPPGMTRTAFVYLVLSGIFLLLNYRWHRARDRAESQRVAHAEQRERLLEEAQEANRAKDRLLANVSHELRTPLNAIAGWSVMMIRPDVKAEDVRRAAEVIKRNAEALARTVDQLLDASLADAGRIGLRSAPVSVGRAVSAAVESMLPEAAARGVTVRNAVAPDAGTIQADQERLHQVLLTVLSNAVKFSDSRGQVTVGATTADGYITIEVTDSGIGIDADYLPSVFDPFSQADSSTTRPYGGVGLGLTIAKELVELMGGHIGVASQGRGRGTAVSLRFPLLAAGALGVGAAG
jgi:signal transduction histidine kinase